MQLLDTYFKQQRKKSAFGSLLKPKVRCMV